MVRHLPNVMPVSALERAGKSSPACAHLSAPFGKTPVVPRMSTEGVGDLKSPGIAGIPELDRGDGNRLQHIDQDGFGSCTARLVQYIAAEITE